MDRIRIVGGNALNGRIPDFRRQECGAAADDRLAADGRTLTLENVPHLADVEQLIRILGNHGVDYSVRGRREKENEGYARIDQLHRPQHRRHHRALRAGVEDARLVLGDRAAAGAHGRGESVAAGRLRHRHAAGRSLPRGTAGAWRADRRREPVMSSPTREGPPEGQPLRVPESLGRRDPRADDGGVAGARRNRAGKRRPRAGNRQSRRLPQRDGREDRRRRHADDHHPGRRLAVRRAPSRHPRPHRDRHLCDGGGDGRRRRPAGGRAADLLEHALDVIRADRRRGHRAQRGHPRYPQRCRHRARSMSPPSRSPASRPICRRSSWA